jgi:hypothetical protein
MSVAVWFGSFFYAYLFANVAQTLGSIFSNDFIKFHQNFNKVMDTLPQTKMPKSIKEKTSNYYDYLWTSTHFSSDVKENYSTLSI